MVTDVEVRKAGQMLTVEQSAAVLGRPEQQGEGDRQYDVVCICPVNCTIMVMYCINQYLVNNDVVVVLVA